MVKRAGKVIQDNEIIGVDLVKFQVPSICTIWFHSSQTLMYTFHFAAKHLRVNIFVHFHIY